MCQKLWLQPFLPSVLKLRYLSKCSLWTTWSSGFRLARIPSDGSLHSYQHDCPLVRKDENHNVEVGKHSCQTPLLYFQGCSLNSLIWRQENRLAKGQFALWLHCFVLLSSTRLASHQGEGSSSQGVGRTLLSRLTLQPALAGPHWGSSQRRLSPSPSFLICNFSLQPRTSVSQPTGHGPLALLQTHRQTRTTARKLRLGPAQMHAESVHPRQPIGAPHAEAPANPSEHTLLR